MMKIGLDRLFEDPKVDLFGKKIALLAHPASINSKNVPILNILHSHSQIQLVKLFGPEHGLRGLAQDMESVDSNIDSLTGLPVISLYGSNFDSLKPKEKDITDIDIFICDLQDVGSRYYTYIYTMAFCMQTCAKLGKKVIVLDRPNPINGIDVEGPLLKKGFESFVGFYPIPIRHGMTIGELALFFNKEANIDCQLHIVRMEGWKRNWYFDETTLPWIPPSPNMKNLNTALVYPGMCLIEATELSEGRGTNFPFEYIGAPFMNADTLVRTLNNLNLSGIRFEPIYFRPTFQKWANKDCFGVRLCITDRTQLKPFYTGVILLKTIMDLYPNDFKWRKKPYEFVQNIPAIDLLSGDDQLRKILDNNDHLEKLFHDWTLEAEDFNNKRKQYLLY